MLQVIVDQCSGQPPQPAAVQSHGAKHRCGVGREVRVQRRALQPVTKHGSQDPAQAGLLAVQKDGYRRTINSLPTCAQR
jgi:hypothetical protein